MPWGLGHGTPERIGADSRITCAPGRKVRDGVGRADSDHSGIRGLPTIGAATHPVIGICQGNAPYAMLPRKRNGPLHAMMSIQIARAAVSIPALQRSVTEDQFRRCVDIDEALPNPPDEPWKAVESMRINAVTAGVGKKLRAERRTFPREPKHQQATQQDVANFLIGNSHHVRIILRLLTELRYAIQFTERITGL